MLCWLWAWLAGRPLLPCWQGSSCARSGWSAPFHRLSGVLLFLWCGVLANTLLANLPAYLLVTSSLLPSAESHWQWLFSRWLGEVNGILALTPALLFLSHAPYRKQQLNPAGWLETALLSLSTLSLALVEFIWADFRHGVAASLWPLFLIALMWVAFRCRLALAYCLRSRGGAGLCRRAAA
jgi:integral membrane sensor domain MASE1